LPANRFYGGSLAGRYGATRHNAQAVCVKDREAGGRSPRPAGRIGRGRTGVNAHSRASHRDAPLGPRRGRDGQADTVDPARGGPPRHGHRPPL